MSIWRLNKIWNRVLVFFLLCISGNPLFIYSTKWIFFIGAVLMVVVCYFAGQLLLLKKLLFWLCLSVVLFALQWLFLETVSIMADVNFIFRLFIAYAVCIVLKSSFRAAYFDVMVLICAVSLIFSVPENLLGFQVGFSFDRYHTVGLYNSIDGIVGRNAGMFWEPGAFQGYIMMIPILYFDSLWRLLQKRKVSCVILLVTLLTTKSTTAYVVLFFFIFSYFLLNKRFGIGLKILLSSLLLTVSAAAVVKLDFVGEKIRSELEITSFVGSDMSNWSRTGAFLIDIDNIKRHPIIGNGHLLESRYLGLGDSMKGTGNGFTGAVNMFGIVFICLYFAGVFLNFRCFELRYRYLLLAMLVLLLFGEYFLNYPLFWALLFVRIPQSNSKKLSCKQ